MKQLVVLLLLMVGTAVAEEPKGVQTHSMYNECKTALRIVDNPSAPVTMQEAASGWHCLGYLRGIADGITFMPVEGGAILDINVSVTAEALVRSFVNYVNAHPADMDHPDVITVLEKAWGADNILSIKSVKK